MPNAPLLLATALVLQSGGEMKPFASPKGKFTILLPARTVEKVRTITAEGKPIRMTIASGKLGQVTYAAGCAEIPDSNAEDALSAARDDLAKQNRGTPGEDSEETLAGLPAKAFTVEVSRQIVAGGLVIRARTLAVGDRLYLLTATVPAARASASESEIKAFFDSFKPEKGAEVAARPKALKPSKMSDGIPAATAPLPPSWKELKVPNCKVTVKVPGAVEEKTMADKGIPGLRPGTSFGVKNGPTAYKILVDPIPPLLLGDTNLSLFFTAFKTSAVGAAKATVISERKFKADGHTIFELVLEVPANPIEPASVVCMRSFVVKDVCISLAAITPTGKTADPQLPGYFDSLRILEKAPVPEEDVKWAKFAPPGLGFSVNMPGTPTEAANTKGGGPGGNHVFNTTRGSLAYLMASGGLSATAEAAKLEVTRDKMIQQYNLELRSSREVTVQGVACLEFVGQARNNGNFMVARYVKDVAARRTYLLGVTGPGISPESPEVRDFFDSFRPAGH